MIAHLISFYNGENVSTYTLNALVDLSLYYVKPIENPKYQDGIIVTLRQPIADQWAFIYSVCLSRPFDFSCYV